MAHMRRKTSPWDCLAKVLVQGSSEFQTKSMLAEYHDKQ
jgi:hypothetical protein